MYNVLVTIALNAIILKYVLENEKNNCECALTWHHKFIKFYAPVVIFMLFVRLLFKDTIARNISNMLLTIPLSIIGLVTVAYSITLIIYFFRLQLDKCECADNWKRYTLIAPIIFFAIIMLMIILITLIAKPWKIKK